MKLRFPFPIKQIDSNLVEVKFDLHGEPLVHIEYHHDVAKNLTETERDRIYDSLLRDVVRASVVIEN